MSSAEFPSSKKMRSGHYTTNVATNIRSILDRKSDVSRSVDMSRHTTEPKVNPAGTTFMSIVKRPKIHPSQAVAVVSQQRMVSTSIWHPEREEQVTDIATLQSIKDISRSIRDVATVSQKKSASKKQQKYPFDGPVYDAHYTEIGDDVALIEPSKKYKTVSPRDARNLGNKARRSKGKLIDASSPTRKWEEEKRNKWERELKAEIDRLEKSKIDDYRRSSKGEPSDFAAISEQKRRTKGELVKRSRNNRNGDDWLIDAMFDQVVGVAKGAGKVAKVAGKVGKAVAREGFHATKTGIRAMGELAEEFERTPMARNLNRNAEAEYKRLRSMGKRARGSIAATGNKRTAGSLVTQHGIGTNNNTTTNTGANAGSSSQYGGIYCRYERGIGDRPETHFYSANSGRRITHTQVSLILPKQIINKLKKEAKQRIFGQPVQANTASTTPVQTIQTVQKPAFNNGTKRVLNQPKTTTRSGLVRRNKSGVV